MAPGFSDLTVTIQCRVEGSAPLSAVRLWWVARLAQLIEWIAPGYRVHFTTKAR